MSMKISKSGKTLRLPEFDYSQPGAYFITICADQRHFLFGENVDFQLVESTVGKIVTRCWEELPKGYPFIALDAWVLMPNHFQG